MAQPPPPQSSNPKSCGECTVCCNGWIEHVINDEKIGPGHPCPHSTTQGCGIYNQRPQQCRAFECMWLQNTVPLPDWLRPDNSKAILTTINMFEQTSAVFAIPVGRKIPPRTLNFLKEFSNRYLAPLVYLEREKKNGQYTSHVQVTAYGPPQIESMLVRVRQMVEEGIRGRP